MAASHAAGYGCNGTVDWRTDHQPYYPPLVNDDGAADFAWDVAARVLGEDKVEGGPWGGAARALAAGLEQEAGRGGRGTRFGWKTRVRQFPGRRRRPAGPWAPSTPPLLPG
jgi:hypothetical protein